MPIMSYPIILTLYAFFLVAYDVV